jgi:hypothetical protein
MIPEADFNDIVDTIWAEEGRMMHVKSKDEERSKDIEWQSRKIVILWTGTVEKGKDRHYFIEPMMQERFKNKKVAPKYRRYSSLFF